MIAMPRCLVLLLLLAGMSDSAFSGAGGPGHPEGVVAEADLKVSKVDDADPAPAGTDVTYTVTVDNLGPSNATNVVASETLPIGFTLVSSTGCAEDPAGTPTCSLGDIDTGNSASYTVTAAINPSLLGTVINSVSVTSDVPDPVADNNSFNEGTSIVAEGDLSITKAGPATATTGTQVTYDLTVTNNGPSDAQSVSIADPTPSDYVFILATAPCSGGFPCALGTIGAGESTTISVTYDIDPATLGEVTNTATVTTATNDPVPGNDSASATTTIERAADMSVTKAGPSTAMAGTQVTYDLTVSNNGPSGAESVSVDDPTPDGYTFVSATAPCSDGFPCALGTIADGDNMAFSVTYVVDPTTGGEVINTATVSTSTTDPDTGNDSASVTTTVSNDADLSLEKTVNSGAVEIGDDVIYNIKVSNAGPVAATNVTVTDYLPEGQELVGTSGCDEDPVGAPTCSLGTVQAGTSETVTLTAKVVARNLRRPENTAAVASDTPDPNAANNSSTAGLTVAYRVPALGLMGLVILVLAATLVGNFHLLKDRQVNP